MIAAEDPAQVSTRSSKWWLVPFGLLGATLVGWGVMIHLALDDPSFAVEPDYYQKAVDWDAHRARQLESERLGWSADVHVSDASRLVIELADARGAPLRGADVRVESFHNARAAHISRHQLVEGEPGHYAVTVPPMRPGLWEIRVLAVRGADTYRRVVSHDVRPGR